MALPRGSVWADAQGTQNPEHSERGIARYIAEHTRALAEASPEALGAIPLDPGLPVPPSLEPLQGSGLLRWRPHHVPRIDETPAIYHVMSPFELMVDPEKVWPRVARRPGVRTAVTLYDLIPLIFRERYLDPNPFTSALYMARLGLIRRADHVFTISQRTADDAMEHLGIREDRITVIDCGVSPRLPALVETRAEAELVLEQAGRRLVEDFLLYVGGDEPRKNLDGLIQAYGFLPEALRARHQLVIVCAMRDDRKAALTEYARGLGIDPGQIVFTGYVPDRELVALYRACGLFVFPSLYEGAGLPILEAMSCDAPVAASRTASVPEILGDLEATFEPSDSGDIARCLRAVLESPGRLEELRGRSRERAAIFTWERVARLTLDGYERALAHPAVNRRRGRKRLAVVTPWPPQASGIATHSRNLVEKLIDHADVDVIVHGEEGMDLDRSLEPDVRIWDGLEFDWTAGVRDYDRILYMLGGSRFHTDAFRALMHRPGVVMLHDVRMLGLYIFLNQEDPDPSWLRKKAVQMYGDRVPRRALSRAWDERVFMDHGIFMTAEIQDQAEKVLLHSRFQEGVLRNDGPGNGLPTAIVPHGIPEVPTGVAEWSPRGRPLVVTYGLVNCTSKRMDLVLEGFARLRDAAPDAHLLVVGEADHGEATKVRKLASRFGIEDSVELHGRAEKPDYWGILASADLAVQLRTGSNGGEASGAVCDCIAARVPTIVTDIGWFRELPQDVVTPVSEDCSPNDLARQMASITESPERRKRIEAAQARYAAETSFDRVAERYATLLEL